MRFSLVLVLLLWAAASASTTDVGEGDKIAEFKRLEHVWNDAHIRGDADALEALWADDLVVIVPGMTPMDRKSAVSFARSGRMAFSRYETTELRIRTFGSSALVSGTLLRSRTLGGAVREDHWQFLKVYIQLNGTWRVVAFSASEAPSQ